MAAIAALPHCGDGEEATQSRKRPTRNVLLISLDSTRADFLGCYGHVPRHAPDEAVSPQLDQLAQGGARLTRALATSSWTLASHMSLFTGVPELVHGIEIEQGHLSAELPTLAETLAATGYRTAGFYSGPYLDPRYGFDRGFERYEACYGPELAAAAAAEQDLRIQLAAAQERGDSVRAAELDELRRERFEELDAHSHRDVSSAAVSDAVLAEWNRGQDDDRPWFVFAHYFDPHYDYVAPEPFASRFDPDYDGDLSGVGFYTNSRISVHRPRPRDPEFRIRKASDRELEHVFAMYEAEIAWTDSQVGRLIESLRASGELENTLIVVVGDHGDEFFEHGNLGHRKTLFEEVLRVPLLLHLPDVIAAGQELHGPHSITDVAPTVLELIGIPPEDSAGTSFAPALTGETTSDRESHAFGRLVETNLLRMQNGPEGFDLRVTESFHHGTIKILRERRWVEPLDPDAVPPPMRAQMEAERSRDVRLLWTDLEQNPTEAIEGYSPDFSNPAARRALERFRDEYRRQLEQRRAPGRATMDEAHRRRLEALGYTDDSGDALKNTIFERLVLPPPGEG